MAFDNARSFHSLPFILYHTVTLYGVQSLLPKLTSMGIEVWRIIAIGHYPLDATSRIGLRRDRRLLAERSAHAGQPAARREESEQSRVNGFVYGALCYVARRGMYFATYSVYGVRITEYEVLP